MGRAIAIASIICDILIFSVFFFFVMIFLLVIPSETMEASGNGYVNLWLYFTLILIRFVSSIAALCSSFNTTALIVAFVCHLIADIISVLMLIVWCVLYSAGFAIVLIIFHGI